LKTKSLMKGLLKKPSMSNSNSLNKLSMSNSLNKVSMSNSLNKDSFVDKKGKVFDQIDVIRDHELSIYSNGIIQYYRYEKLKEIVK